MSCQVSRTPFPEACSPVFSAQLMKPTECEGLLVCLQFVEEGWYPGFKPKSYPATPGLEGVGKVGLTSSLILLITYTMGGPFWLSGSVPHHIPW